MGLNNIISRVLLFEKSPVSLALIVFDDKFLSKMELRHLRYFTAVAEHLNYSEASRHIHVAQPAISQTILDLEEEIGVRLLVRDRRTVRLTAAGEAFRREALEMLRRNQEAVRLARRASLGEIGQFRVGFLRSAMAAFLPGLVQEYHRQFPDVELTLRDLTSKSNSEHLTKASSTSVFLGLCLPSGRRNFMRSLSIQITFIWRCLPPIL
jgi:DNA-binding transcriptional ArsR family regulator